MRPVPTFDLAMGRFWFRTRRRRRLCFIGGNPGDIHPRANRKKCLCAPCLIASNPIVLTAVVPKFQNTCVEPVAEPDSNPPLIIALLRCAGLVLLEYPFDRFVCCYDNSLLFFRAAGSEAGSGLQHYRYQIRRGVYDADQAVNCANGSNECGFGVSESRRKLRPKTRFTCLTTAYFSSGSAASPAQWVTTDFHWATGVYAEVCYKKTKKAAFFRAQVSQEYVQSYHCAIHQ